MTKYAENTTVPIAKSKAEIEMLVEKYGATGFMSGWNPDQAMIAFEMSSRRIVFKVPLPLISERQFVYNHNNCLRTDAGRDKKYNQALRQRWRALLLVIKAKLESVESGIEEFEEAFLSQIALPNGETAGSWMKPQIAIAYESGDMPPLLPAPSNSQ